MGATLGLPPSLPRSPRNLQREAMCNSGYVSRKNVHACSDIYLNDGTVQELEDESASGWVRLNVLSTSQYVFDRAQVR